MIINKLIKNYVLIVIGFLMASCDDEDESPLQIPEETFIINQFIQEEMEFWYFWEDQIPDGLDPRVEPDSRQFFQDMLFEEDRFSIITDDAAALNDFFEGTATDFGWSLTAASISGSDDIVGFIDYVIPNTPAYDAGITRGDVIRTVNGQTPDIDNFGSLLFGNFTSATFGIAEFRNGLLQDVDRELTLTSEIITENPVFLDTVYNIDNTNIGYLVYNGFRSNFENEILAALTELQARNISELIIDLRYNSGGSLETSRKIASTIAPFSNVQNNSIYSQNLWNDLVTQAIIDQEGEESDNLLTRLSDQGFNFNLSRVFFITQFKTASASEQLINNLKPYMDVTIIGGTTVGKAEGSITREDPENHTWAIQPIVLKAANANGETNFEEGFIPDFPVQDDFEHRLGTIDEANLSLALDVIAGIGPARIGHKEKYQISPGARQMVSGQLSVDRPLINIDR